MGTRILTVEDDERIRTAVRMALEDEGWEVEEADTGEEALQAFTRQPADVVLIDIMLPGIDGFDVCRSIRRVSDVPIVMVTARADTHDVVAGLEAGADDYLTKPFSLEELVARLRGLLRRAHAMATPADEVLKVGDLVLDGSSRVVTRGGEEISLTGTEFELLRYLMRHPKRAIPRAEILDRVWNYGFGGRSSVVDLYVSYLRRKIDAGREPMIHTVRGVGYLLRPVQ